MLERCMTVIVFRLDTGVTVILKFIGSFAVPQIGKNGIDQRQKNSQKRGRGKGQKKGKKGKGL